jgi:hypothetical protein
MARCMWCCAALAVLVAVAGPARGQTTDDGLGYARPRYRGPLPVPVASAEYGRVIQASYPQVRRRTFEQQLREETAPHVQALATAVRPSLREDAATALAEGRFGSRPEVKRVLAGAAMTDPAPVVRAHCIRLLTSLGYHEPEYVAHLRVVAESGHPAVRLAATIALARLAPRV